MNKSQQAQSENSSYFILIFQNKNGDQIDMARKEVVTKQNADSIAREMCKDIENELPNERTIPSFTRIQTTEISAEQYLFIKQKKKIVVMETKYFDYYYSHLSEFTEDI